MTAPATELQYPLDEENRLDFIHIADSCGGILCLDIDHRNFAVLWNPCTHKFKKLPSLKNPPWRKRCCYTRFAFGYDYSSHNYKVVAVFRYQCDDGDYKTRVKVHTLGTNSWRRIQALSPGVTNTSGKIVSGALNWLSCVDSNWVVVSLDLGKESYQELIQPVNRDGEVYMTFKVVLTLGVLRDCLCIISNHDMYIGGNYSDVWLMKEYGNTKSWTKLFSIRELSISYPNILHMSEDEEVLLELEDNLVLFNSKDDTYTQIQDIDRTLQVPKVYVESLISPCSLC